MVNQAIAGVAPESLSEVTIMTVWPSIAATRTGQALGRLYAIRSGCCNVLTVGNLIALASIPVALLLYFFPWITNTVRRYRLTNRRLIVERGLLPRAERSVSLDDFDAIDVVVQPGQAWYPAGDLVFRRGNIESFRIYGVRRPESFRQTCLKAQRAHSSVKRVLSQQRAVA